MPESFVEVENVDLAYDRASGNAVEDVSLAIGEATFLADTVYVMSKRPGHILARRAVDLPQLREHIGRIRNA